MEARSHNSAAVVLFLGLLAVAGGAAAALGQEKLGAQPDPHANAAAANTELAHGSVRGAPRSASRSWAPPDVDEAVPSVAPDVACSLPDVLQGAGQRVKELVANLEQFTATEEVEFQESNSRGQWGATRVRRFQYVVDVGEVRPGGLNVEENRNDRASGGAFPTPLVTTGFAALALIFHPFLVDDYEMRCEGLGQWREQPAWQVRFQQRADRPGRTSSIRVGLRWFAVNLKGRAWIAPGSYQILRLEVDLAAPIQEIRLLSQHAVIEYRAVFFAKRHAELWLPERVDLYMDFRGHRYHHRHSFSDFLLFSVDVTQQIHAPAQP